jgi:hypothetical protein
MGKIEKKMNSSNVLKDFEWNNNSKNLIKDKDDSQEILIKNTYCNSLIN